MTDMLPAARCRVLHLIPSLGEGGAERQLSLLAPALTERGIECHVAFNEGGPNYARLEASSVRPHRLPKRHNAHPARITDIIKIIRDVRPDFVQTWLTQMDVAGAIAARICGIRYILTERASPSAYPANWKSHLRSLLGKQAAMIMANSSAGAAYWHEQGAKQPIVIIPNSIVADAEWKDRPDADGLPKSNILLSAGRFSQEKNIDFLIMGFDLALDHLPDHHVIIFGDGYLRDRITIQVAGLKNASRFHLPGFSKQLAYWRKRADVFVSVSHHEGHPNVILEAASEGCPLVISDIPSHRACISNSAAVWVDKDSPSDIAHGIVSSVLDPVSAKIRARNAANEVRKYTLDAQVELFAKHISRL